MSNLKVGSIVKGTVVSVSENLAYVSVGGKSEARIYLEYYTKSKDLKSLKDVLKEGDEIVAEIAKNQGNGEVIMLSRLGMEEKERRDKVIKKIINHKPFMALVKKSVEGGLLLVKDDVNLFLPDNYVDLDKNFDKLSLIGTETKVQFVKTEYQDRNTTFIVSRKQVIFNEERRAREEEFQSINQDDVLEGVVQRITDFGAFIKFKAVEGLIHTSEASHYHIKNISEVLEVGQTVTVKVIKKGETRLQLSIKALEKTPWELFLESHKVGDKVEAKVVKKSDFWMLCEVEREIVGILNKEDYSWDPRNSFQGSVNEGDTLTLQITYIDKEKNKMTLSKKHLEYNPWHDLHVKPHDVITGTVLRFTNSGAIVKVQDVEGFLADRDASNTNKKASEVLKEGDIINAEVLRVDTRNCFLSLSIKTIEEKKDREFVDKYLEENVSSSNSLEDLFKDKEGQE